LAAACSAACGSGDGEQAGTSAQALSPTGLVISQVYGGGGNSNAAFKNDYVELFNSGSASVSTLDLSIQYAPATNPTWQVFALPDAVIDPGHYFLVQLAADTATAPPIPTADAVSTINIGNKSGNIALVQGTARIVCADGGVTRCAPFAIDFVGYGSTSEREGTASAPMPGNDKSIFRNGGGCIDTDENRADFTVATPAPRNALSAPVSCAASDAGTDAAAPPADANVTLDAEIDASVTIDASDASVTVDAGVAVDASDASVSVDAGVTVDASVIVDSGKKHDANVGPDDDAGADIDASIADASIIDARTPDAIADAAPRTDSGATTSRPDSGEVDADVGEIIPIDNGGCACATAGARSNRAGNPGVFALGTILLALRFRRRRARG
jgi:MYXO-CTERM domain-containing protein